jgi:hypothetical protein
VTICLGEKDFFFSIFFCPGAELEKQQQLEKRYFHIHILYVFPLALALSIIINTGIQRELWLYP